MTNKERILPGLLLVAAITAAGYGLVHWDFLRRHGASPLTLALVIGALFGNFVPRFTHGAFRPGLTFAQRRLLRAGVALYGFNLSVQQIAQVGSTGIIVDIVMVVSTIAVGLLIGRKILGMDSETALLVSAGSAICGAAAVVATVPMLKSDHESVAEKSTVAVATVVLFGTLAMFLYPLIFTWIGGRFFDFGIYVGSTVHEVAQVVAIGSTISDEVAHSAVIVKMIRVMLLVPFLIISGVFMGGREKGGKLPVPWFAVMFVLLAGVNSLEILPPGMVDALRLIGLLLLTAAMASLGIDTNVTRMGKAGVRPLLLATGLFVHLVLIGGLVNRLAS